MVLLSYSGTVFSEKCFCQIMLKIRIMQAISGKNILGSLFCFPLWFLDVFSLATSQIVFPYVHIIQYQLYALLKTN